MNILLISTLIILFSLMNKREAHAETGEKTAMFAGGCFWCMEYPFKTLEGVKSVDPGYTGGKVPNPTYEEVCSGTTGHYEAVRVIYDPEVADYNDLLKIFWAQIDPTDPGGQFADRGSQYKTAIFFEDDEQKKLAEASRKKLDESDRFKKPVATEILPAETFYEAEDYHKEYYKRHPMRYQLYRAGSGRQHFIEDNWGDLYEA